MAYAHHASHAADMPRRRHRVARGFAIAAIVLLLLLIAARIALPSIAHWGINHALSSNQQVTGHVGRVHIALLRGAYEVEDVRLRDAQRKDLPPFADVKRLDLALDMRELVHGSLLAKTKLEQPVFNVAAIPKNKNAGEAKQGAHEVKKSFMPMSLARVEITSGTVMIPTKAVGGEEVKIDRLFLVGENLYGTGVRKPDTNGHLRARARLPGDGALNIDFTFVPGAQPVQFVTDVKLEGLDMAALNPLIQKEAGMDVKQGNGNLYAQLQAADGRFQGYVKPMIQSLKFTGPGDEGKSLGRKLKQGAAELAKDIFRNDRKNSVASRIPISGSFDDPKIGVWAALHTALHHAFVHALKPGLDQNA